MRGLGYGAGYKYAHNAGGAADQTYLPERLVGKVLQAQGWEDRKDSGTFCSEWTKLRVCGSFSRKEVFDGHGHRFSRSFALAETYHRPSGAPG